MVGATGGLGSGWSIGTTTMEGPSAGTVFASKIRRTGSALWPIESGEFSSLGLLAAPLSTSNLMLPPITGILEKINC
jgi:hypothetical protein